MTHRLLAFAAGLLVFAGTNSGQSTPGSLTGTVFGPGGAAVRDAPIQARNKQCGAFARTASDARGRYTLSNLAAGGYEISISMPCCAFSPGISSDKTLVIDTIGFNDRGWIGGYPRTEKLHMTERYRRTDFGHLEVRVTIEDPGVLTKPWNMNMVWDLAPQEELIEYVCENNKAENLVGK